jgi:hypothetical protein
MDEADTRKLLSRAVHETLEIYVTPVVRQELLREALTLSGLPRPPSTVDETNRFLWDGLFEAAARRLGTEIAEGIIDEIWQLLLVGAASPRRGAGRTTTTAPASGRRTTPREIRRRSPRPNVSTAPPHRRSLSPRPSLAPRSDIRRNARGVTTGPAVSPGEYLRELASDESAAAEHDPRPVSVLVATRDPGLLTALTEALNGTAEIRAVRSVLAVVQALEGREQRRVFVLLDGQSPGVRPLALAALADDLIGVTVVLCRTSTELEHDLSRISPATRTWVRLRPGDSARELALGCIELVS